MRDIITSTRLTLRRMGKADIVRLVALCGDIRVAGNLSRMPHPYRETDAYEWLDRQSAMWAGDSDRVWAIDLAGIGLIGTIGLHKGTRTSVDEALHWEMGYWLGFDYWGQGYATEAGKAVLVELDKANGPTIVTAGYALKNPNSGHVLEKIGFHKVDKIVELHVLATGKMSPTQLMIRPALTPPNQERSPTP